MADRKRRNLQLQEAKRQAPRSEKGEIYFQARVAGRSYQSIADEHGLAVSTVFEQIKRQIESRNQHISEMVPIVRQEMTDRLDRAVVRVLDMLANGDDETALKAIDRLIKLEDSRAKLYGVYAPAPVVNVQMGQLPDATPERALALIRQRFGLVGPQQSPDGQVVESTGESRE